MQEDLRCPAPERWSPENLPFLREGRIPQGDLSGALGADFGERKAQEASGAFRQGKGHRGKGQEMNRQEQMERLAALAKTLDALADQVRAGQKAVMDMQRALFESSVSVPAMQSIPSDVVREKMMVCSEVMSAFGIRSTARSTLSRRMSLGLIPRPMHPHGQQAAVWRKSQVEELLEMTLSGAAEADIKARVTAFNAANGV